MKYTIIFTGRKFALTLFSFFYLIESCPCKDTGNFQSKCLQLTSNYSNYYCRASCYCICPGYVDVFYPSHKPPLKHVDQVNFVKLVSNHTTAGGLALGCWGDDAMIPRSERKRLYSEGVAFLSHALNKAYSSTDFLIFIPDHLFIRSSGFTELIREMKNMQENFPFEKRVEKCFWRGSSTGKSFGEAYDLRFKMCQAALNLSWVDTVITKAYTLESDKLDISAEVGRQFASEKEWVRCKGLINVDGWGLFWRLASGSTVFKFESNWTNAYIERMIPWMHYIPLKSDLSDFSSMTSLVRNSSATSLLKAIAHNAEQLTKEFEFSRELLRVAKELEVVWALREVDTLLKTQEIVDALLTSLDDPVRSISARFPFPLRLKLNDFKIATPPFVRMSNSSKNGSCWADIPHIPTLIWPNDSTLLSFSSNIDSYFGTENAKHLSRPVNISARPCFTNGNPKKSKCPTEKHYVLTMAEGYSCNKVSLFLRTLRSTGSCAKVIVFRSRSPCSIESSCGDIEYYPIAKYPKISLYNKIFILFLEYLNNNLDSFEESSKVLAVDFNDLIFQRDPFTTVNDAEVILTEEGYDQSNKRISIWSEPTESNKKWFMAVSLQLLGRDITTQVKDMPVLNSGVIIGSFRGMYKFLWVFAYVADLLDSSGFTYSNWPAAKMKTSDLSRWIMGQGILNFIY